MVSDWLDRVIVRDLESLCRQLEAYPNERDIWRLVPGVENSAGTLALHLAGNLQHYVGARLGGSGYVRDREAEFSRRDLPREEVLQALEDARSAVSRALQGVTEAVLESEYPDEVGGVRLTTGQFLTHLAAHLAYHLGQVDYHRRLVSEGPSLAGMVSIRALTAE